MLAQRGFTLLEIIVAMGIMSFVGLAILTFQMSVLRGTATMQSGLIAQQQVRNIFQDFVSEVRTAQPSAGGGYPIFEVGTSTFTFFSNIDNDANVERVKYYLGTTTVASTTIIYKEVVEPVGQLYLSANKVVTEMVTAVRFSTATPIFTYYDENYSGTSSPLAYPVTNTTVRLVKISIPVDPNAARSPIFQTYTTQVSIRNLKENL